MTALDTLLTPQRVLCGADCGSKKRVLETIAGLVAGGRGKEIEDQLCESLNARERLGSTGIGEGIAIPHCREADCSAPTAALVTLARPVDFAAIDDNPVDIVFALVVPDGATDEHLRVLARLAGLFSQPGLRERLRACRDDESLRATMLSAWAEGDEV
ncbi:MAG: PTS sugar transporter subunit IIA [Gammaproteobacteria bacterium]|nr:PTS sugar transporter subunit IIA [Gammaproteobacteria bacterium]MBK9469417.1 PTS sugar transporter subunit IIA [Gammaproteobacteria bacterium]MBP6481674.1 PTS sugar transporter subunit IIA [Pseudomonadales bacterium]MBP7908859.1 PTS sugar transporter subunit IIA [Pseudomonadales bacterium]